MNRSQAFTQASSTDTCLMCLCDYIRQDCGKSNYTGMAQLDLQKAFDTANPSIPLDKLTVVGMNVINAVI